MKTAREFADDLLDAAPDFSAFYELTSARDAEHRAELDRAVSCVAAERDRERAELDETRERLQSALNANAMCSAELLKVQDDLLQGANREVALEATIERLGKDAAGLAPGGWIGRRDSLLAAPPPAESTPVLDADETKHVLGMVRNPPPPADALKAAMARTPAAPPDDIRAEWANWRGNTEDWLRASGDKLRASIRELDTRLAALEAKGEPGTHAFVENCNVGNGLCYRWLDGVLCGKPIDDPSHPKGARP